ncbi:MAG TPA: metallophosphoesterase family protein, partial [Planctomycetota bacterium]|nr:metallophosphoesterase family protein [Planctomycetota bacterium]
ISDIHANLEALEAVLADLEKQKCAKIYCLGDIIGYGPSPREVADIVQAVSAETVKGNHEDLVIRRAPKNVHESALAAAEWTRKKLIPGGPGAPERKRERWEWLKALPLNEDLGEILLAHGMPADSFAYVLGVGDALKVFQKQMGGARMCFIGHTHVPGLWFFDGKQLGFGPAEEKRRYGLQDRKVLVNVGSVGQPRDHDPRACYVVLHGDGSFEYRRVEYDCEKTARRIYGIPDLPNWLGERLLCGE